MEVPEIEAGEKRTLNGGERFRPDDYSSRVGTDISERGAVGFDDEIKISRAEQGNPFVPLKAGGNACGINGTRRERRR